MSTILEQVDHGRQNITNIPDSASISSALVKSEQVSSKTSTEFVFEALSETQHHPLEIVTGIATIYLNAPPVGCFSVGVPHFEFNISPRKQLRNQAFAVGSNKVLGGQAVRCSNAVELVSRRSNILNFSLQVPSFQR